MLNQVEYGQATEKPSLLIVHGLYGSARNWGVIAKRLSDSRHVVAVDQRNHGASPWFETHSYHDMAADLAQVIEAHGKPMDVMGHSMGGKAAMVLALTRPELVNRLIVVDISPVEYAHSQVQNIDAMRSVDLSKVTRRSDAEEQLAKVIEEKTLVSFFTQSLDVKAQRWVLNLDVLERDMPEIIGFPEMDGAFQGGTLFLSGGDSDYVNRSHRAEIKRLFPDARFASIPGTGHWLHAEKPREFEAAMRGYFELTD